MKSIYRSIKRWILEHSVPVMLQLSQTECGAACLAMILGYHGHHIKVSHCLKFCGGGRDGTNAEMITAAARRFGLQAKGYTITPDELTHIPLPAIIHWNFNHFVILEHWSSNKIKIVDPAIGRRVVSRDEFNSAFTGVVLTFKKGDRFKHKKVDTHSAWRKYLSIIFQVPGVFKILFQVLAASFFLQVLGLILPIFTKILVDHVLVMHMRNLLFILGLGILILVLSYMVVQYLRSILLIYLQARIDCRIMVGFIKHALTLPFSFFQKRQSGDLLMRMSSNVTLREMLTNQTLSIVLDGFFVLVYLFIIFFQAPFFGFIVLIIGGFQMMILFLTHGKVHHLMQNELAATAETQSYLIEILKGIATLKASGSEDLSLNTWSNRFYKEMNISLKRHHLLSIVNTAMRTLQMISPLILLWFGGFMVLNGTMSLGTMLAIQALGIAFLLPLTSIISTAQQWQMIGAHLERILDVLDSKSEQIRDHMLPAPRLQGKIEVKKMDFKYDKHSPRVLRDISFHVQPSQKLALVGRTSAGKSTLALLLLGLYRPTNGEIKYDGNNMLNLDLRGLRKQFGAVLQESFLFQGSIRKNIAFNNPELNMDEIKRAAQLAAIHDEIMQMPMGYETIVSEGGIGLSGGQRQRLSIARAVAHKPAILLLDEATSHLDTITEAIVDKNLSEYLCTRIVIAHRLSTISNADLILVLDNGSIVESGQHEELIQQEGYYQELLQNQVKDFPAD